MKKNVKGLKIAVLFSFILFIISLCFVACTNYFSGKSRIELDMDSIEFVQFEEPKENDTIATIKTTLGDIKAVLYPQYSPNAVQNFIELAESGYYNNTYVFHSEKGIYTAMGSPLKDGTLPEGYDESRELVEMELNQNLWPFKGAICSMTTTVKKSFWDFLKSDATYYCGSRFCVINSIDFTDEVKEQMYSYSSDTKIPDAFIEHGGIPNFSQQITVIGQTYEGFDVIDQLTNLEGQPSDDDTSKIPVEDVMILSVEIGKYSESNSSLTTK